MRYAISNTKSVAELSSLKCYNRSKRGLLHRVEHYAGHADSYGRDNGKSFL